METRLNFWHHLTDLHLSKLIITVPSFTGVSKFFSVNTANLFVIGRKEWLQRQRIDAKACSHDPIFGSNYLSGIVSAHRNVDSLH